MLKRLRLLLLVLIAISWFVFILPYLLVQTQWGAHYAGLMLSNYNSQYTISFERVSHSITKPYELTFENLKIQDKAQSRTYLTSQKVVIGLLKNDLLQLNRLDYLLLENGQIEVLQHNAEFNVQFLQLKNISVHYLDTAQNIEITLSNIYGGAKPWSTRLLTDRLDTQFNFTIQRAIYNQFKSESVFVQGIQKNQQLRLSNLGGNINQGFFTANLVILPNNQIDVAQLKLNNIHFQSTDNVSRINDLITDLPYTTVQLLSIINGSVSLPNLTIEKANLEAKNIRYDGQWQLDKSDLSFDAQSIVWQDELVEQPLLQWYHADDKIILEQAIALWNKGNIKLTGSWQNGLLTIDNMIAGGIRYQLPTRWYQTLDTHTLPDIFPDHIVIKQFMLMPSLLIDTDPQFPFQLSSFEAFGNDININTSQHHVNINGSMLLKADNATFNTVELNKPDLSMTLTDKNYLLTFSTLIEQGILEGQAHLFTTQQLKSLTLNAHTVDSQVLALWHLINNPLTTNKFTVELQGLLIPLSLNGVLKTNGYSYPIKDNKLTGY